MLEKLKIQAAPKVKDLMSYNLFNGQCFIYYNITLTTIKIMSGN